MPLAVIRSQFARLTPMPSGRTSDALTEAECCVTCGRPSTTPFCPHCGERRAADHPYTLRAVAEEAWDHLTPADGRAVRTLWTLVRRPGALTVAYMRGVRRPYLAPLALFAYVNAAYFLYVGVTKQQVFTTPLRIHLTQTAHADVAQRLVDTRIAARHVTMADYERRFNAAVDTQSKSLLVAMVPGFALLVALCSVRRRRTALHHLTFGFHAIAAMLLCIMVGSLVLGLPIQLALQVFHVRLDPTVSDRAYSLCFFGPFAVWTALALRRAYGDGPIGATLKAAGLAFGFLLVLFAYRALLFFTTFWAT